MPHTEGPWQAMYAGGRDIYVYGPPNSDKIVARLNFWDEMSYLEDETFANANLIDQAPEMYALLKKIEWSQGVGRGMDDAIVACPSCQSTEDIGHSGDCRLAAVLKAVEGE